MIENLKTKIEKHISYLPPIPMVMIQLIQALKDDDVSLNQLGKIIERDPSMSVNVLKIANSAFFSLPNKVNTIDHAVRMLGTREITMICISCGTSKVLKMPTELPLIDPDTFWHHSVATGVISSLLGKRFRFGAQADFYLAGLMHDAGVTILDQVAHDTYKDVATACLEEKIPLVEAELRLLGESHGAVGGWLMEKWQLPVEYAAIARFHHDIASAPAGFSVPVAVVALADMLADMGGFGFEGGGDSNVDLTATEGFAVIAKAVPQIGDMDLEKVVWEESGDVRAEIAELKTILTDNGR